MVLILKKKQIGGLYIILKGRGTQRGICILVGGTLEICIES